MFCIPIEKKPERCSGCLLIGVYFSCSNVETDIAGTNTKCGVTGKDVNIFGIPPSDCPIVEMPDVEILQRKLAVYEEAFEFVVSNSCPPCERCIVSITRNDDCEPCYRAYLEAKLKEGEDK